jgi:hypothetical protein
LSVRRYDGVTRTQVGLSRGRACYRRDDRELSLEVLDPNPNPFIFAGKLFAQWRASQGFKKHGVVIGQRFSHAARPAVVQLAAIVVK